nr:hypothetical protein [uncultured Flavobacterium sp.]
MIRIFKGEHEIEVVKDTLTLKRENRFMDNDFKIQSNSYPFMIIENEATRLALSSNISTSKKREQFHEVQVITPEGNFVGELQILSYTKNFRKCNLVFYSPLYRIKDEKINTFLPDRINTHPNLNPPFDYEENRETEIPIEYSNTWAIYGANISTKGYPQTLFNLPTIYWPLKYGEDLDETHDWFHYKGVINDYVYENGMRYMSYNSYTLINGINFTNVTVNAPKVYLLAPLKQAVESVGYKLAGAFANSNFIKKILLDSKNDNLTAIDKNEVIFNIPYTSTWVNFGFGAYRKTILVPQLIRPGRKYRVEIRVKKILNQVVLAGVSTSSELTTQEVSLFGDFSGDEYQTFSVEITGVPSAQNVNMLNVTFVKMANNNAEPLSVSEFKVYEISNNKGYSTHPIINLQRFCPDWSFVDYINELKKLFNLKVTTNDHEKTLNLEFFETKFSDHSGVELESILVEDYDAVEFDSLLLKYDNVHDDVILVDKNAVQIGQFTAKTHTKEISTKFKYLPVKLGEGLTMSDFTNDKGGVGLMIYDHQIGFYTLPLPNVTLNGISYDLTLQNIFTNFHRKSFTNYLSGGVFPAKGIFDQRTIKQIAAEDFVFIDNKRYYVNSMQYKELSNGLYATEFELLLMLY